MAQSPERRDDAGAGGVPPGAISALLQELVRAPEVDGGAAWERDLAPGAVIGGRFELVREVGRGGFGVVFEARDRVLGRAVAFKAIRPGGRGGCEDRLLREAEAAARLSHPNLVTLHDLGRSEHGPYLVLELLRGRTLAQRLDQGPMTTREALRVAVEVARGLAHAHAQGVIHRDLTPGNVFLCEDGQVKVLDLGMALAFGRRKLEGGTPTAMAPEQWRGAPEDERTDVFALGALLHRMLAGEAPFPADGGRALLAGRAAPALDVPELPALGALVGRMLALDPVARPRDAGEALAALAAFQEELSRSPPAASAPVSVRRARRGGRRLAAALAIAAALVAAVAGAVALRRPGTSRAAPASIAVLPFADMSPAHDQGYLSDGVAEEILNALAQVEGLRVTGRTSSFAFKGRNEDLRTIGEKLGVGAVLEGSVRKAGNRVRITAQVIQLPGGYHLWSETFDRELNDVFAVQDEIAQAVVEALKVKLLPGAPAPPQRRTGNPEAYASFLRGRQAYARASSDGIRAAVEAFQRAIALDPGYAPAWAALSLPLYYRAEDVDDPAERRAALRRALEAAEKAVALDPALAEGYSARAHLRATVDWDWRGARADLEHALALNPNDPTTLRRYALLRAALGHPDEGLAPARRAADLDPLFPGNWSALSMLHAALGQYAPARAALDRAVEVAPESAGESRFWRGMLELAEGSAADALASFEGLPLEPERLMGVAMAQHTLGREREARRALEAFAARHGERRPLKLAIVNAWLGDRDAAFAALERAYARHDADLASIRADCFCIEAALRDDPRWPAFLRKLNLTAD